MPLSATLVQSRRIDPPAARVVGRTRRSQRLRAVATVLALIAVMLVISAIGLAAALVRGNGSDSQAEHNLDAAARMALALQQGGTGATMTVAALASELPGLRILEGTVQSTAPGQVSVAFSDDASGIYGWYGAVKSKSGRCVAAAVIEGKPQQLVMLPQNCTGDAAKASLMPTSTPSMVPTTPSSSGA